jgi:hypothetical protein
VHGSVDAFDVLRLAFGVVQEGLGFHQAAERPRRFPDSPTEKFHRKSALQMLLLHHVESNLADRHLPTRRLDSRRRLTAALGKSHKLIQKSHHIELQPRKVIKRVIYIYRLTAALNVQVTKSNITAIHLV